MKKIPHPALNTNPLGNSTSVSKNFSAALPAPNVFSEQEATSDELHILSEGALDQQEKLGTSIRPQPGPYSNHSLPASALSAADPSSVILSSTTSASPSSVEPLSMCHAKPGPLITPRGHRSTQ
ncbi:hypothetical protein J1614_007728 [Plenodomus biglobosus]|nr:hypothetical protein J1614_007728 [Plenodomus biglobosus]